MPVWLFARAVMKRLPEYHAEEALNRLTDVREELPRHQDVCRELLLKQGANQAQATDNTQRY